MKKFNLKNVVLNPVFSSTDEKRKCNSTLNYSADDEPSAKNIIFQIVSIMLALPVLTALILLWLKLK